MRDARALVLMFSWFVVSTLGVSDSYAATITPITIDRSVSADASASAGDDGESDSEFIHATEFSTFDATARASATASGIGGFADASGQAVQVSSIAATGVDIQGYASAGASAGSNEAGAGASAHSEFELTFSIDTRANFSLTGSLIALNISENGDGNVRVFLQRLGGPSIFDHEGSFSFDVTLDEMGMLDAGSYVLNAGAWASGFGDSFSSGEGAADFDVLFEVSPIPLPAPIAMFALSGLMALTRTRRRG